MLRITAIDTPTEQKLILEGRLTGPWVAELDFQWEEARHASPGRKFIVDLKGVTRIDARGEGEGKERSFSLVSGSDTCSAAWQNNEGQDQAKSADWSGDHLLRSNRRPHE